MRHRKPSRTGWMLGTDKALAQILQDPEQGERFRRQMAQEFHAPARNPFRPCEVDGTPAFFHRWVDEDRVLLHTCSFAPDQHHRARLDEFKRDGLVYPDCRTEAVRHTFALVEYDDGTVGKVEPEKVKFTDRRAEK